MRKYPVVNPISKCLLTKSLKNMKAEIKYERSSPTWLRLLQIGLGIVAIGLSLSVIIYPSAGVHTLSFLLAAALLVVGFERVVTGFIPNQSKSSQLGNIALGAIVMGLSITVLAFPLFATGFLAIMLAFGLLFSGIARIVHGVSSKKSSKGSKVLMVGVGVFAVAVSAMIFSTPLLGIAILNLVLAIALLIIGIQCIASAASGRSGLTRYTKSPSIEK